MLDRLNILLQTFKQQLAADKKKSAILSTLALLLLILVGRLALSDDAPPESANADDLIVARPPATHVQSSAPTPSMHPIPRAADPTRRQRYARQPSNTPPEIDRADLIHVDGLSRELARNPFTTDNWSLFSLAVQRTAGNGESEVVSPLTAIWSQLSVTMSDYESHRQQQLAAIDQALDSLELQSTLIGPNPIAYISGRLVRPGDRIDGFSVVRIEHRRVLLERDGHTRELTPR